MYIQNSILKPVKVNPSLIPIAEGTVLTLGGNVATGSDAYGIVPQKVEVMPITGTINVAVSGRVDLTSPANKGVEISDEIKKALIDIDFVPFAESGSGFEVPTPEAEDDGKVLTASNDGTASWQTPSGGVPPYTATDIGKSLSVVEDAEHPVVTTGIPEQSVVFNEYGYGFPINVTLPHSDDDIGREVTLYFNGTPVTLVGIENDGHFQGYADADTYFIEYHPAQGSYPEGWEASAFPGGEPYTGAATMSATYTTPRATTAWSTGALPAYSAADNWKFLQIINGVPVWSYINQ